jgi:hypothetical protein
MVSNGSVFQESRVRYLPAVVALALIGLTTFAASGQDVAAVDFKTGQNTWTVSKAGDWVEYRTGTDTSARFAITAIAENGDISYDHSVFKAGKLTFKNNRTDKPADALVQGRVPTTLAVTWGTGEYVIGDANLSCETASWAQPGAMNGIWFCKDVPCGGVVKTLAESKDTIWLTAYSVGGKERRLAAPEPEPEPEPETILGPEPARDFGAPITMKLPDKIAKEMKDQGVAITRMRVYFEEEDNSKDGAVIEFEGMRTEVPVIYAAFNGEQCDKELGYEDWLKREGRFVDLAFDIKTRPKTLKGMKVQIVHAHLQGETQTELSTFEVTVPADGDAWDSLRLRGAQPGINRYTLVVTYTNSVGETTTHKGFSHWVVVQAPPMFEFLNTVTAKATRTEAGGTTVLDADVKMMGSFILHHGLDVKDCTMRITRRGNREMDLSKLPAELRRVIEKESIPPGWQEVARVKLGDAVGKVGATVDVEDSFVRVTYHHAFSASAAVLPVTDEWEYRFELSHRDSNLALATWTANIDLSIAKAADISAAKLKIRATNVKHVLEVAFTKK